MFSTCGPARWRLNGPDADAEAANTVRSVPITPIMNVFGFFLLFILVLIVLAIFNSPLLLLTTFGVSYFLHKQFNN